MRTDPKTLACVVATLAWLPVTSWAATPVSGIIAGKTWTSAGSPYQLTGDVFVTGLTIESNVVVEAVGNYELEVAGLMRVRGASNAPVLFTAQNAATGWKGILFRDAVPGSFFNHAVIELSTRSAVRITNTPPAFTNCVFRNNTSAGSGGGIFAEVSGTPLVLQDCLITNNYAGLNVSSGSIWGGGLCVVGSVVLSGSTVVSNRARGAVTYGGGVFVRGNCTVRNSQVTANLPSGATQHNADGFWFDTGSLDMANSVIRGNGSRGAASRYGGALSVASAGKAALRNSLILDNAHQGVWVLEGAALSMVNCVVNGNTYQGLANEGGTLRVTNSIVYFNYAAGEQIYGTVVAAYSDIQGGVRPGPGNISFSPALCPETYALIAGSPCIDAGSPDPAFNDTCIDNAELCTPYSRGDARNDMGVYGGPGACAWLGGAAPEIVTEPRNQSSCLGRTASFSIGASGAEPLAYQWFFQNVAMPGCTTAQLTLTNLQSASAGTYHVTVANAFGSAVSAPAQLVVNDACIDLKMYAGLTIEGLAGRAYVLRYTTDLGVVPTQWTPLATNVMTSEGWFYLDMQSPFSPRRYYGVQLQP